MSFCCLSFSSNSPPAWTSVTSWRWFRGTSSGTARRTGASRRSAGKHRAHAAARVTCGEISQLGLLMNALPHAPKPPTQYSINPPAKSRCLFWHCYVQPKQGIPLSDQWRRLWVFAALPVSAICLLLLKAVQTHFHLSPLAATLPAISWLPCPAWPRDGSLKCCYCHLVKAKFSSFWGRWNFFFFCFSSQTWLRWNFF